MKKTVTTITKTLLSVLFALLVVCAAVPGTKVSAADIGAVTNLRQTTAGTSTATIEFDASTDNKVFYSIQLSDTPDGKYTEQGYTDKGTYYFSSLKNAGRSYYVMVVPYYRVDDSYSISNNATADGYLHDEGTPSKPIEIVTRPNNAPASVSHTDSTATSISLSWKPVDGANLYYIGYIEAGSSADPKIETTTETSYVLKKLKKNSEYTAYIWPARQSSTGYVAFYEYLYAYKYNIPVTPDKASKPDLERWWSSLSTISVSTNSIGCADGYQYEVYTAYGKKAKKVKTETTKYSSSTSIKYKNFKKYQYYKIRVRAYSKTSTGKTKYGKWSSYTYACPSPELKMKKSGNNLKTSWSKVDGASRYVVYVSDKENSGYKKFTTTKKTSCTITKYGKKKLNKNKTYYVYVAPQIKVGKKYVTGLPQVVTTYHLLR